MAELIHWICNRYNNPGGRHAGVAEQLPASCPHCGASVVVRRYCACGNPIDNCSQAICSHPFARDD
jgi:hypothetical protein